MIRGRRTTGRAPGRARRWTFVGLVLASGLLVGCLGRDAAPDTSTRSAATIVQPKPEQPITAEVERFNSAIASSSCVRLTPLIFSTIRESRAGAPTEANECSGLQTFLRGSDEARFTHAAEYGTAALMEAQPAGEPDDDRLVSLWALDTDGKFRSTQEIRAAPAQIGTRPPADARAEENAAAFVSAARDGDCRALEQLLNPEGRPAAVRGGPGSACGATADGKRFAAAVAATRDTGPVELGATRDFAFYGVPTEDGYFTVLLGSAGEDRELTVLAVLQNTRVDSIRGR